MLKALLLVSEKKNFKVFLLCSYVSNLWPLGRGQFWPQGHYMNNLGRSPPGDATYQISKLCTFYFQRRRILKFSFFCSYVSNMCPPPPTCDPRGGASLGDATYQISKLCTFYFQRRRILKFCLNPWFPFVPMFQTCAPPPPLVTPGVGPVLTPRASYEQPLKVPKIDVSNYVHVN